jgi:serine/threonine protein kinase
VDLVANDPRGVAPDQLVGTTVVERYELLALAATGGMGCVYRARDRVTDQTVAVKVLAPSGGDARRFAREAEVLAGFDHPGVVRYLAHGSTPDGSQYLVMEWLTGEDLASRLEEGTLAVEDALVIARQVADALAAAYRRHVVHRDIKPANIFLVDGKLDNVKLLDFGIARALTDSAMTVTGTSLAGWAGNPTRGLEPRWRASVAPVLHPETIASPEQRRRFWERPLGNGALVRLGTELGS